MADTSWRNFGIGLDVHLPGPAVLIEIVHVVGAQVDLQGVEDVADLHAVEHALGAVDVQVQPGRVGPGAVEKVRQPVGVAAPGDDLVAEPLQLVEAQVAAVLDDQLEAAGRAQAVDRRRAEGRDNRPPHFLVALLLQRLGDRVGAQLRVAPLVERLQQDVHRAQVGRVGVQDQRLAGKADRVLDARHVRAASFSMRAIARCVRSTEAESGNCTLSRR